MKHSARHPRRVDLGLDLDFGLMAALGIPALATDLDGLICLWNRPAAELYGRDEDEMLGTGVGTIRVSRASAATIVSELLQASRWHGEVQVERATDSPLWLEARATVLFDDDQRPSGFAAAFKDLSRGGRSARRAAASQSQLRRSQRIRETGPWKWGPRGERLAPSDTVASPPGLSAGRVSALSHALAALPSLASACGQLWRIGNRLQLVPSLVSDTRQGMEGPAAVLEAD